MQHRRRGLLPQLQRFYSHFSGCMGRWVVFADVRVTVRERFDLVVTAERPGYRGSPHVSRSHKLVAQTGDCHDQFRMLWFLLQFFAQARYVHVDRAGQGMPRISPNRFQQFLPGDAGPDTLDEVAQQLVFTRRKIDGLAVPGHFGSLDVHPNGAELMNARTDMEGNAPQQNFDAREEFGRFERLVT